MSKTTNHPTKGEAMISKEQYQAAVAQHKASEETMNAYHRQEAEAFKQRVKDNPVFTDDELFYSATALCPCGHGLAYPKMCGGNWHWDCSAILKGIADPEAKHTGQLPFAFYGVKGESEHNGTTRGVFLPKPE